MDYEKIVKFMERQLLTEQRIERLPDYNGWEVYAPLRPAEWYNWMPEFTLVKGDEIRQAAMDEAAEITESLPPEYTESETIIEEDIKLMLSGDQMTTYGEYEGEEDGEYEE